MKKFKLEQWFDVSKPISELEMALTEMQLLLEMVKQDIDPESAATHKLLTKMKRAVVAHNGNFA